MSLTHDERKLLHGLDREVYREQQKARERATNKAKGVALEQYLAGKGRRSR